MGKLPWSLLIIPTLAYGAIASGRIVLVAHNEGFIFVPGEVLREDFLVPAGLTANA